MRRDTVDAWALKDLAGFTARTHPIAFDLQLRMDFGKQRERNTYLSLST